MNHKDVALKFLEKFLGKKQLKVIVDHCIHTSYIELKCCDSNMSEYLYFDITDSGCIQMRKRLPCDGFTCFQTKESELDLIVDDFINQYESSLAKQVVKLVDKILFINDKLRKGI